MSDIGNPNLIYSIPRAVIMQSLAFLRSQGTRGHEGVVLWPAMLNGSGRCDVRECLVPQQVTGRYFYRIPDSETFRVIEYVADRNWVVPIQLHSHPEEAFHSPVDDECAFVQHRNGISIVVPDFAAFPDLLFLDKAIVYALVKGDEWRELTRSEVERRFSIVGG
jgi:hypothetical protein